MRERERETERERDRETERERKEERERERERGGMEGTLDWLNRSSCLGSVCGDAYSYMEQIQQQCCSVVCRAVPFLWIG